MPPRRAGPKAWSSRRAAPTSRPRRYARRSTVPRPLALTTNGTRPALGAAPFMHKFTRMAATIDWVSNGATSPLVEAKLDTGSVSAPCILGLPIADFSGVPQLYSLGAAWQFALTDVTAYSEFTALFDQYRIDQVDFEVSNLHNSSDATTNVSVMPTLMYAPDYDDASVPSTAGELLTRQRTQSWTFRGNGVPLKFSVKPRYLNNVYRDSLTSAYNVAAPGYLDVDSNNVPYYGVKMWLQNCYITSPGGPKGEVHLRFKLTYHLSFKDPQ